MAKRGILDHPKTIDLADNLGIMDLFAVGLLEGLWHWTAQYRPDGDMTGVKPSQFARAVRYTGDANALWEAYIASGWIDRLECGCLVLHEWSEHSDDHVDNRLARSFTWYADGKMPRMRRLAKDEREKLQAAFRTPEHARKSCVHAERTESTQQAHVERTPSALPVPVASASSQKPVPVTRNPLPPPTPASGGVEENRDCVQEQTPRTLGELHTLRRRPVASDGLAPASQMLRDMVPGIRNEPPRSSPMAAAHVFLEDLYDEFARAFGAPMSIAEKRSGWEDPLDAWNRCFAHVKAGDVELDGEVPVVTLLTPKPKDLKAGLERYQARVKNAMRKAFGREVQLVPRDEMVAA